MKTLDLMLFYVEIGTEFTNTFGDIDGKFYNSMLSMYNKVVKDCEKNEQLLNLFKDRLYLIVKNLKESDGAIMMNYAIFIIPLSGLDRVNKNTG